MPSRANAAGYVPEESELEYEVTTNGVRRRFWSIFTHYKEEEEASPVQYPPKDLYEPKHAFRDALRAFRPPLPVLPREKRCANPGPIRKGSNVRYAPYPYDVQPWETSVYHRKRITEDRIERLEEVELSSLSSTTASESFHAHQDRAAAEMRKLQRYLTDRCSRRLSDDVVDSEPESRRKGRRGTKTKKMSRQQTKSPSEIVDFGRGRTTSTRPSNTPTLSEASSSSRLRFPSYPSSLKGKIGPAIPHSTPPLNVKGVRQPNKDDRKRPALPQTAPDHQHIEVLAKEFDGMPGPSKLTDPDAILAQHLANSDFATKPVDKPSDDAEFSDTDGVDALAISGPECTAPCEYTGKGKAPATPPATHLLPPEIRYLPRPAVKQEAAVDVPALDDFSWVNLKDYPEEKEDYIVRTAGLKLSSDPVEAVNVSEKDVEGPATAAQTEEDEVEFEDAVEDGENTPPEQKSLPHKRIDSAVAPPGDNSH